MATISYSYALTTPEFIASNLVAQTNDQTDPSVAMLLNGTFFIAFTSVNVGAASGFDFAFASVFDSGSPNAGMAQSPTGAQTDLRAARLSNGGLITVGVNAEAPGSAGGTSIVYGYGQMPSATAPQIIGNMPGAQTDPAVAGLVGDRSVIVWANPSILMGTNTLRMTVLNNAGTVTVKDAVAIDEGDAPSVGALSSGAFVVTWSEDGDPEATRILAQRFDSDGNALGSLIVVDGIGDNDNSKVIGLDNGGFAVVYEDTQYNGSKDISIRTYNAAGAPVSGPSRVNIASLTVNSEPAIAKLSNGFLTVSWTHNVSGTNNDLYMRTYRPDGVSVTLEHRYQGTINDVFNERQSALAATPDGRLFAAWNDGQVLDGSGSHIGAAVYALRRTTTGNATGEVLNGDALQDVVNGMDGADTIVGGGGDDQLFGGEGDDYLHSNSYGVDGLMKSGAGDSVLDGGAGKDGLFAGAGDDTLSGGAGDDGIVGGAGDDTLSGGDGQDFLFGGAFGADGARLPQSGADTLNGGDGNDGLYGFDGDDVINGDAGNDYVEGGDAGDTIKGGSGNDYLLGQGNDDTINGGLGFDYMYGGTGGDDFIFRKSDSADWILDFSAAQGDKLRILDFGYANFSAIPFVDLSTPGNPAVQLTVTTEGVTDQLTIFGVTLAQLNAGNVLVA